MNCLLLFIEQLNQIILLFNNLSYFPILAFDCRQVRQAASNLPGKCSLQACELKRQINCYKINKSIWGGGGLHTHMTEASILLYYSMQSQKCLQSSVVWQQLYSLFLILFSVFIENFRKKIFMLGTNHIPICGPPKGKEIILKDWGLHKQYKVGKSTKCFLTFLQCEQKMLLNKIRWSAQKTGIWLWNYTVINSYMIGRTVSCNTKSYPWTT